ncbi:PEPxxWA-CTERM sorting domain-containing protein [Sandarakinorhabdus sp.]|uniref:PEPxxWA-CTERM sorting domain-containing protein n=1 Tax=Sandarakinorhabdus sp. TaxID=1916663 RepID=UPI003F71B1B8
MKATITTIAAAALLAAPALAAVDVPVDLTSWTAQGSGNWVVQAGNNSVRQTVNTALPTVFFGPGNAQGTRLRGTMRHYPSFSDDDFIGFVLGFKSGDLTASTTDFLLIDWKKVTQSSGGCSAPVGLAISRVTAGLPNSNAGWCHLPSAGVTELARAATLGSTGWVNNVEYLFEIDFTASNVTVNVDGVEQFNINGTFSNGAFGFYNFSQPNVEYAGITTAALPAVPEPATWAMLLAGFGLTGAALRRRRLRAPRVLA